MLLGEYTKEQEAKVPDSDMEILMMQMIESLYAQKGWSMSEEKNIYMIERLKGIYTIRLNRMRDAFGVTDLEKELGEIAKRLKDIEEEKTRLQTRQAALTR